MLKNNEEEILNRLDSIEKKLDQLNDPFNINGILSQRKLPSNYTIINETETING